MHNCEQSTIEAAQPIEWLTLPGQTILDPFCGIATTGIAALKLDRRFIGIEIDSDTVQLARTNILKNLEF